MNLAKLLRTKLTRRGVQIALGILWLLDGGLQLQHQMFSSAFATSVIAPAGQGQPIPIYGPINFEIHMLLLHPAIFDTLFALIQLSLGVLILNKRTVKIGLLASVVWALGVWYMGEGLGGILSGHTTLLMGAPGAALIYAILALAVMPSKPSQGKKKIKQDRQPAYWLAIVWAVLWIGGSIFQITPGQNSVSDVSSMIAGNASGAPGWLASLDTHTANVISGFGPKTSSGSSSADTSMPGMNMPAAQATQTTTHSKGSSGYWFILLLFVAQLFIGIGALFKGYTRKIAIGLGVVLSLIFWVVGQSLGAYFTGLATDPNTGPLFVLLGLAILGSPQLNYAVLKLDIKKLLKKLDKLTDQFVVPSQENSYIT